jgi:flagella basal body P-ring formation protein FlgA
MRMLASGVPARRYELGGAEVCVVQRRSLRISSERLASVARGRLEKLTGAADGQVGVELVRAPRDLHLAEEGPEPELRASLVGDGAPTGRVRVNVDVVRGDERLERATAVFDVKVWQSVATARRRIAAGEPLGEHNVAFVRRETARSGSSLITSADDLQGRVAGRPVPAGGLVDRAVLAAPDRPVVVRRNQRVRLVARIGNLRAMALGKAGSPARPGEVVKVVNLATGREVAGVAQTDGSVHVLLGDDQ